MTDTTSLPCDPGTDEPLVSFQGKTPYDDYVHASVLSSLQQPLTNDPNEMPFLVTTQVMELWFTLVVHEWRAAQDALVKDDHERAMDALRRSISAHHALNDSLGPIARMTPAQFNGFREAFGAASGFQSAKYRQLEFLLGDKSRSLMNPQRADPGAYAELEELLNRPSLYDAVLGYLHRRGLPVPEHVLQRDVTGPYEADPGVEEVWRQIYAGPQNDPLLDLGEALTDIAELVLRWRGDHLLATRRAMGSKAGSGGSSGVEWLEKRAARPVFPELWTARGHV
ncbi:tryptophan 2,3-dioxygenase [Streptomyces europaeiscabiei]|uniref:tryptophan 2,3-dioxygenase n=1 Tax=Streptomyces europaeiscabiei TaxID=146819 RepID=UPI0029A1076E|nr:tryptophan 2,3-dioxygenase family protein [Streptomyces europaeiscabiei]MDX3696474.1 tryptophan 2,3-dioxygenase family protein [Streptomyces europaeiscabiei]